MQTNMLPWLLLALASPVAAQEEFTWSDLGEGRLELRERSTPVLVYNYGPQLKAGAPENRRRCCYLFPIYTPAGTLQASTRANGGPASPTLSAFWLPPISITMGQPRFPRNSIT